MNPEIKYYVSVFFRRLPLFLLVVLSISSSMIAIAVILPTVYTSRAVLLVESAQIPGELAVSTVQQNAVEQLQIVEQRLMTRANLIDVSREFEVYTDLELLNPDQIVDRMKEDTTLKSTSGRDKATIMEVSFSGRSPDVAAKVANEYVTRILADNARERMRLAEDTLAFFEQEVERLETDLDLQSQRILKFQNENADALPDSLNFRLSRQSQLQERLSTIARDRSLLEDQRSRLVEVFDRTGGLAPQNQVSFSPAKRQLAQLREDLNSALAVLSEENPRVKVLRARVEELEKRVEAEGDSTAEAEPEVDEDTEAIFKLQLAEIDAQLEFLEEQTLQTNEELAELIESIRKTPNNTIALEALQRDYENVRGQFNLATQRLSAAVTGERIEVLSKGERITVIEQAAAPSEPSSPNRPLIAGGGVAFGLASGIGLILLLEFLNKAIRRPVDLTNGLGITPLATIPYISTTGERIRRRILMVLGFLVVLGGIPGVLYFIHISVMPLDLIIDRIMDQVRL